MTLLSRNPVYNLNAVIRETGLRADVLRAWERRYGVPRPERTPGGHRLYSDYDIAVLKWLRARQAEGLSISRAVELWKELDSQGHDPQPVAGKPAPAAQSLSLDADRVVTLRSDWLKACLEFDVFKAESIINHAFAIYPVETVCFDILQNGLSEFGNLWYLSKSTAQQEHFATALATRRVETLIAATPGPTRPQTVLVGCPAGEWHSFPALLLSLLLRRKGYNVVYLGANIPLLQIEQAAKAIHPDVVVLAAQQLITVPALQAAASAFQNLNIPVAYGGLIFNRIPELRARIAGFFLGEDLTAASERVEQLVSMPFAFPIVLQVEQDFHDAAETFRLKQTQIEQNLWLSLKLEGLPAELIRDINGYFAAGLCAALELGNLEYLQPDTEWVIHLMIERGIPAERLKTYLNQYRLAVRAEMGLSGELITAWISSYMENYFDQSSL